jgi:hypothetical protein
MPKVLPLQDTFQGGEVTPKLFARTESEGYLTGLKTCENFVVLRHGPVESRLGTRYIDTIAGSTARIFSFIANANEYYTVVISDNLQMRIYDRAGVEHANSPIAHTYDAADIEAMQAEMPPGILDMYFVTPLVAPAKLVYDRATDVFTFAPVTFTGKPAEGVDGVTKPDNNWPESITFFQGRSWWGSTPTTPETFWASKSGLFENLTPGSADDDGMEFTMNRKGRIEWMEGIKNLIVGTASGEFIVTSDGAVITPSDVAVEQQSANGSRSTQAQPIGVMALYVSPDGSKLRDMTYRWTESGWVSRDLSFTSEHFAVEGAFSRISYARDPESFIWLNSSSGSLYGCTFEPELKIMAWHRHVTNGEFLDTSCPIFDGKAEPHHLIKRNIDGGDVIYLERFDDYRLDANDYYSGAATTAVSAPHLANETVSVLADGAVHPDITLDGSGNGTIQFAASEIVVGFSFTAKMETLPADFGAQAGSAIGSIKHWNRIFVRLKDSAKPKINGVRPPDRSPATPMNTPEPVASEDVDVRNLGRDRAAIVTVEQDLPLICTVLGIFGEISQSHI